MARLRQFNMPASTRYRFGLVPQMQCSVIEWARHLAELGANSAEFAPNGKHPVINLLPEQQDVVDLGGTMRLGLYPCRIANTLAFKLYQEEVIYERHRHRRVQQCLSQLVFRNRLHD